MRKTIVCGLDSETCASTAFMKALLVFATLRTALLTSSESASPSSSSHWSQRPDASTRLHRISRSDTTSTVHPSFDSAADHTGMLCATSCVSLGSCTK